MERKRIITATPDEVKFIAKAVNVSTVTVYAALKYKASTQMHRKIRKYAIERGNPQMVLAPEFEAIYLTNREDADKKMTRYMVQPFENGATLESKGNGTTRGLKNYRPYRRWRGRSKIWEGSATIKSIGIFVKMVFK